MFAGGTVSAGGMTFQDVLVRSGTVTLAASFNVGGNLQIVSGTLDTSVGSRPINVLGRLIVSGTLRANGSILSVTRDVTINGTYIRGTSTLVLSGMTGQTLGGTASPTLASLTINDPAGVALGTSITLTNTLTLTNGQFSVGAHVLGLSEPIAGVATKLATDGTSGILVTGAGVGIVLPNSVTTLGSLTVSNPNGLRLSAALAVQGTMTFSQGNVVAVPFELSLGPGASVVRTSGHVIGGLRKSVPAGSGITMTFEIGDASAYAPLSVVVANILASGELSASTMGVEHPDIATSTIDPAQDVNRWWTLSGTATFDSFDATLTFAAADTDAGAAPASFIVAEHDGSAWRYPAVGSRTSSSIQALGVTALGSFAVGEAAAGLSVAQSADRPSVVVGQNLTYTITIANAGPADAPGTVLDDSLGAFGRILSVTPSQGTCSWTISTASCALGIVATGGSATVVMVASTIDVGALANTATVSTSASDPDPSDNTSTLTTSVRQVRAPTQPPAPSPTPSPPPPAVGTIIDGIAPGVNRGQTGFTTKSLVVRRGGYVTYLVRLNPAFAGRPIEIWKRQKNGVWVHATSRLVAADGTVHYYVRITVWTALWAKIDRAASHGRIATAR